MPSIARDEFVAFARSSRASTPTTSILAIPIAVRLIADHLTPVVAYRRLVALDHREAPSFLLESVEGGERQGRYSILGANPLAEVIAHTHDIKTNVLGAAMPPILTAIFSSTSNGVNPDDPFHALQSIAANFTLARPNSTLPASFLGGWVGYAAYDSVRYSNQDKLPFSAAPKDDRHLPDLHFGFYSGVVVFDNVDKTVSVIELALVDTKAADISSAAGAAYDAALARIRARIDLLEKHSEPLHVGAMPPHKPPTPLPSNMTREQHAAMVADAKKYIAAGDIFQVVLGQRFERKSAVDPFDVYRALRCVNPSPYMVYLQAKGCILIASSPEILCRVKRNDRNEMIVTNRPLAGTRRRGKTHAEDAALERELLADAKERAEHIMLVDLGRNDVGIVAQPGSINLPSVMEIERYSHVMHISSTVTGTLREGLTCWDALRATLPVGTISGAPKLRAMQIIDELEPIRRGPYGGGLGCVGLGGEMDIALTLRTIVTPLALTQNLTPTGATQWTYHLQAAGGIVADSVTEDEYMETVNKAAGLARAIEVAEGAFGRRPGVSPGTEVA